MLTSLTVAAMRDAMDWPGCVFEEQWRAGKVLSEDHVQELRLLRALVEMDGLVKHAGGTLRTTAYGWAVLKGRRSRLQANLFRNAFWQMSLNLFGGGECGHWPQQQIGTALWALSTTGDWWQEPSTACAGGNASAFGSGCRGDRRYSPIARRRFRMSQTPYFIRLLSIGCRHALCCPGPPGADAPNWNPK